MKLYPGEESAISIRPTHGSATQVEFPSVIPADKRACEVFWVSTLLSRLPEFQTFSPVASSCPDDSHGNHDVVISLNNCTSIGVQVTELTYELHRKREDQRNRYIHSLLTNLERQNVRSPAPIIIKCFVPFSFGRRGQHPPPDDAIVDSIVSFINSPANLHALTIGSWRILLERVENSQLYTSSWGNIGVDCDLDVLPRSLEMYQDAILYLRDKKSNSHSPWLLVWSVNFWRDDHIWGDEVRRFMEASFATTRFNRVYFIESIPWQPLFKPNLHVHPIKI